MQNNRTVVAQTTPVSPPVHVVQQGETLSQIAETYELDIDELKALNNLQFVDYIYVGQELRLSSRSEPTVASPTTAEPTLHIVRAGETLSEIANAYGFYQREVLEVNGLSDPDEIYIGQQLLLPLLVATPGPDEMNDISDTVNTDAVSAPNATSSITATSVTDTPPAATPLTATVEAELLFSQEPLLPAILHTVKRGETLSEIAEELGFEMTEIMDLNGISDPDAIYSGQALLLPVSSNQEPPVEIETPSPTVTSPEIITTVGITFIQQITASNELVITNTLLVTSSPVAISNLAVAPKLLFEQVNLTTSLNQSYTVSSGDTLNRIALRAGVDLDALIAINQLQKNAALSLQTGQQLILPATRKETSALTQLVERQQSQEEVASEESSEQPESLLHEILPGDNLSMIAQAYGLSTVDLMKANGIANPDTIFVGQRLLIPPTPVPQTSTLPASPLQTPTVLDSSSLEEQATSDDENSQTPDATETETGQNEVVQEEANQEEAKSASGQLLQSARRGFFYYTVKAGDTLGQISSFFNTTPMALIEYNGLPNTEIVYLGLELRIPFGPPSNPQRTPPTPSSGSRFVVSISRQECWLFRGDYIAHAWRCSTGYGQWTTRIGTFHVKTKIDMAQSGAHQMDMPYWLGIYDVGSYENGIHGLPIRWQTGEKIWSELIGKPATFGCAMLNDADAEVLYNASYLGMPVHIVQ
ncbi:MAG: LysM peptidoglycan-binding domain-containing protein [Chloroflexota bacterium]